MAHLRNATPLRSLFWPGQLVAWALILFPLSGLVLTQLVPGTEGAFRRTRLLGLMADGTAIPLLGIFLGAALAALHDRPGWRRFYSVVSGVAGLALVIVGPLFMLDALQVRRGVKPELQQLYEMNSARSLAIVLVTGAILLLLAAALWRSIRQTRRSKEEGGAGLVLGGNPPGTSSASR